MVTTTTPQLRTLALGWGVQSTTLGFMALQRGCGCALCQRWGVPDLEPLDLAIHADTTHERRATYLYAQQWTSFWLEQGLPIVVVRPKRPDPVRCNRTGSQSCAIPAFTAVNGGRTGQIQRQCTGDWKIEPQNSEILRQLKARGIKKTPGVVEKWLGISLDEWHRQKPSDKRWATHRFPLLERKMRRSDCIDWLKVHGFPVPPKSACTFCPFHSKTAWQELKRAGGGDWDEAVAVDAAIRDVRNDERARKPVQVFVHARCLPLAEAVQIPEDFGMLQLELLPTEDEELATCDSGYCFM